MTSGSGYAGRHRDPLPPVPAATTTHQGHYLLWLIAGAVAAVMLLFSVVVYPSLAGNQTPQTGVRPAAASTSDRGVQYRGAPEASGTGSAWPSGTTDSTAVSTTSTADATAQTADPGTTSAEVPTPTDRAGTSTAPRTTSSTPAPGTTPPVTSSTPASTTTTESNPRVVARALFPEFGFADGQFGCLNTMWNRLGLWGTPAQVRPGLIYVKGRYGTPCAAWDEVQRTGNY